jgi:hypothetical protein
MSFRFATIMHFLIAIFIHFIIAVDNYRTSNKYVTINPKGLKEDERSAGIFKNCREV